MYRTVIALMLVAMFVLAGCGTHSNNPIMGFMGARTDYSEGICAQSRADTCKQFPQIEQGISGVKIFLVVEIYNGKWTKKEVLSKINKATDLLTTDGISTGYMFGLLFDDEKDYMFGMALADAAGFNFESSLVTSYIPDAESRMIMIRLLQELKLFIENRTV